MRGLRLHLELDRREGIRPRVREVAEHEVHLHLNGALLQPLERRQVPERGHSEPERRARRVLEVVRRGHLQTGHAARSDLPPGDVHERKVAGVVLRADVLRRLERPVAVRVPELHDPLELRNEVRFRLRVADVRQELEADADVVSVQLQANPVVLLAVDAVGAELEAVRPGVDVKAPRVVLPIVLVGDCGGQGDYHGEGEGDRSQGPHGAATGKCH